MNKFHHVKNYLKAVLKIELHSA